MNLKRILLWIGSLLIITALVLLNLDNIMYAHDMVRSFLLNDLGSIPAKSRPLLGENRIVPMGKTYAAASSNMFHLGPVLLYKSDRSMKTRDVAAEVISCTDFYRTATLSAELEKSNMVKESISAGTVLFIPSPLPAMIEPLLEGRKKTIPVVRGLYFSGSSAGTNEFLSRLPVYAAAGINAVVIDLKDIGGSLNWKSATPLCRKYETDRMSCIDNPAKMIRELRKNGIYVIGRMAVFRDELLVRRDPSLAIRSARTGTPWSAGNREIWCDPTNRTVQEYNLELAGEMARFGFDEVQFDYIRFPTGGDISDARFACHSGQKSREEIITQFLDQAHREVKKHGAFLSIDIFGVVAWGKDVDIRKTGQRIELLSSHCDVISPMLYPSHFNDDFDGYRHPGDEPYYFIGEGCRRVMEKAGGKVIVRPWLQAFGWRVSHYNEKYIMEQVRASNNSGARGYLFWNASNSYDTVMDAMSGIVKMESRQSQPVR